MPGGIVAEHGRQSAEARSVRMYRDVRDVQERGGTGGDALIARGLDLRQSALRATQ